MIKVCPEQDILQKFKTDRIYLKSNRYKDLEVPAFFKFNPYITRTEVSLRLKSLFQESPGKAMQQHSYMVEN